MKNYFLLFFGVASLGFSAEITQQDLSTTLSLVDRVCGDTWCGSSDYRFRLDKLTYEGASQSVKLSFNMSWEEEWVGGEKPVKESRGTSYQVVTEKRAYDVFCRVSKIKKPSDLYSSNFLNQKFEMAITECVAEIEKSLK